MEVRRAVQAGDVDAAIEKVNDLNPEASQSAPRRLLLPLGGFPHIERAANWCIYW